MPKQHKSAWKCKKLQIRTIWCIDGGCSKWTQRFS